MTENEGLFKRDIIDEISKYLTSDDVIVLHGARQVGKTTILYYLDNKIRGRGNKTYFIDLEDSRFVRILDAGAEVFIKHLREEGKLPAPQKKHLSL